MSDNNRRFEYSSAFLQKLEEAYPEATDVITQAQVGGVMSVEMFLKKTNDTDLLTMAELEWANRDE
jgi:hypothetical protein